MTSQVLATNRALLKIGGTVITDPDENSASGRVTKMLFQSVAQEELRLNTWSFALTRASLPALSAAPAFGFSTQYQLPADCLRLVYINDIFFDPSYRDITTDDSAPWTIEGRALLTNMGAPLNVRYVKDVSADPELWDAAFVGVFACALGREAAPQLTKSQTVVDKMQTQYERVVFQAKRSNAIELPPSVVPDSSWMTARL